MNYIELIQQCGDCPFPKVSFLVYSRVSVQIFEFFLKTNYILTGGVKRHVIPGSRTEILIRY